jgi:hypothetical protein
VAAVVFAIAAAIGGTMLLRDREQERSRDGWLQEAAPADQLARCAGFLPIVFARECCSAEVAIAAFVLGALRLTMAFAPVC